MSNNVFLGIIGSRNFVDYDLANTAIKSLTRNINVTTIVSGGASGADYMGKLYSMRNSLEYKEFPARWDDLGVEPCKVKYNKYNKPYNALAGHNRNKDIIKTSDYVIAFWDMKSPGTLNSINLCYENNKPIVVIDINKKLVSKEWSRK